MRNIILFIFMFLSIGIKAQSYDDSNVYYYVPVGYSVEDVRNTWLAVTDRKSVV